MQIPSLLVLPLALAMPVCRCQAAVIPQPANSTGFLASSSLTPNSAAGFLTNSDLDALASSNPAASSTEFLPDAPLSQAAVNPSGTSQTPPPAPKQTKRILFIIPNFRSVTADEKLPPITTKEKFKLAFLDSFDYSAFAEVAILAGLGDYQNSTPEFRQGAAGYGRYYWHSFVDNLDGDLWTEAIVPTVTREDPRYYTLGHGNIFRRSTYSVSRLFITRNNQGNPTPNFSEIVGNGAAAGISGLYYPSAERGWTKTGQRWVLQVGIDGLSNLVKEFWPDINQRVFHDKY